MSISRSQTTEYRTPFTNRGSASASQTPRSPLKALLALFVLSGIAALIYEIIWFQLLELVIGSSAISLGVLLATYMGGMCIGSLALARLTKLRGVHPLRLYAFLELGIGACGLFVLAVVPLVSGVYAAIGGHGPWAIFVRAIVCAVCLLPPTVLMGATLPAASRTADATPTGVAWIGFLYGGNTIGAVIGSILAGFYLLRVFDLTVATLAAVVINLGVAATALATAKRFDAPRSAPNTLRSAQDAPRSVPNGRRAAPVYLAIALSGAAALGAEVVWTRLLSLTLGATTYTFSMILGVFLTGLGIGSAAGASIGRSVARPRVAFGWCQLLQIGAIAFAASMIGRSLPYWPINPSLAPSPWFTFQLDLTRCVWTVLPAACLWGASFPLALASSAEGAHDPARVVGTLYAANTVGGIVGALGFSLLLVPHLGTQSAQRWIIALAAVAAAVMLGTGLRRRSGIAAVIVTGALAIVATVGTPAVPGLLVAYGRYMVTWLGQVEVQYVGEGMNSSVAVTTLSSSGATQFHVSGKVEASTLPQDMRLQRMLAHLPALVHPHPASVLVVGFGAGVTAGSFVPYPDVQRLTICEIEPLIPHVVSRYFTRENNDVLNDRRTHVVFDDARSFILSTHETFDIITSDPIHPWVKGAASLYTLEYFEAVKRHLNPGGVVTQWVPLYESTAEAVKSEIATFFDVFPNGIVWANNLNGGGYDLVLLAQEQPTRIDVKALAARFGDPRYAGVAASLGDVGFDSPIALFSTYAGDRAGLQPWLEGAAINRDRNLRLQYLAAVGLNAYRSEAIYTQIASYRRFPDQLFVADDAWKARLRAAMR
ncbi:MAG TPA: fused MFS/spermidine synthase [Gemmatimonadaceae bacterium]|nr:fused MFS/spermidine synthase [Gemmatimonadaceae bacterium]